jgi:secondary thiamine-phosphate synthase enzyme
MKQAHHHLTLHSGGQGLYEVTTEIAAWLGGQAVRDGLLTVFIQHTSASLLIQENADHDVLRDIETFFAKLVPEDSALYRHTAEGDDDMPAHIKGALTQTQLSIPVRDRRMQLGQWQGIYVFEHRRARDERHLALHMIGD